MQFFLNSISNSSNPSSLSANSRRKRMEFFIELFSLRNISKPIKILDIGGTEGFWVNMHFNNVKNVEIHLLNLNYQDVHYDNFKSIKGDATNMREFGDHSYDIVFSNSVIEHLYSAENQLKMASEVRRVGKSYFIQTPNYWFPIEPHFVFPFFQFLPRNLKIKLISNFALGHFPKFDNSKEAERILDEIKLVSIGKMKKMFPGSAIYLDKFFGLNKSMVAYKV